MLQSKNRLARAGFTVAELLVGATLGVVLLGGMMYLVTEMLRTERTETARSETEREMAQALDYIASELREAVLVYDRNCLGADGTGNGTTCQGLRLPRNTVLAFWKREELPDLNLLNLSGAPSDEYAVLDWYARNRCGGNQDCQRVMNYTRTQYVLVVYVLCRNPGGPPTRPGGPACGFTTDTQPRGPARIVRGYFYQYQWAPSFADRLANLDPLTGPTWPSTIPHWNGPNSDTAILVSNVDWTGDRVSINCPPGYLSSTGAGSDTGFPSFFACVRERVGEGTGFVQDVYLYLRGNAAERAGLREIERGTNQFRPAVETQVRTRGSYNRRPS
ncbi:MAG: hypothetical protein NZL92_04905 [Gloeomargarita sp. SKYG116]|nr:hypothetical protein [Gloeomargarita sp. SKYG116]MCS7293353.1 hypothetical protein [Gloeomargarita sp. SKYB120]MDW8178918.1 hypothetical protein [Gloeomargarita sp. SKYBB_i_bin120]MDW8401014.1 hypothetical protein [Gloeomargarita sp. SKYGB_i_bin116]